MDLSMRLEAVEVARNLLARFRAEFPGWQDDETPLEQITNWLGCEVATFHPQDYPEGTYGFLEPGEPLIWLCRDLPATLRRFTLAHELGHVILHSHISTGHDLPVSRVDQRENAGVSPDDPCQLQDVREEMTDSTAQQQTEEWLGLGQAYDPRSRRELAANLFAAELLMPRARIEELYVVQGIAPEKLAARFAVSQAALLNRLVGLFTEPPARPADPSVPRQPVPEAASQEKPRAKKAYDEFQQAAIEAATPALVVAGPGSGKTSTLIGRVEYLLQSQGMHPEQILALTFSRKAAQEMQERLQQILPAGLPSPAISTFHAFCADLLRTYGSHVGLRQEFSLVDDAEGYFLLQSLAESLPLQHYQNLHAPASPFRDFLKAISRAKDELITPQRYRELAEQMQSQAQDDITRQAAEHAQEIAEVYEIYQRGLEQRGDSDFGGLLMLAVQLLTEHQAIRSQIVQRYQHILVDEFQDINRASGVLLRLLAGEQQRVWVVGDANQAIYGFRGASPANIANFHQDYPNAVVLPLSRNYRSRPDIVSLADTFRGALLEQETRIENVQTARATESDPYITLAVASDEASELGGLVRDIAQKLDEGYSCRDIVVLCRTRAMARKVTRELARAGLPVSARSGMMEQEHIKNLLSLLLLIADTSGMGILRAAHLPAHPLSQEDIEALLVEVRAQETTPLTLILRAEFPSTVSAEGCRALTRLALIIKNLVHNSNSVWSLLAQYLLGETAQGRELLADREGVDARIMREDYVSLLQFARSYDARLQEIQKQAEEKAREAQIDAPPLPDIQEQIAGFLDYLQILLSLRADSEGKREESSTEGESAPEILRVMTVHASKGLEFPVVYLPGLTLRRFPLQRRANPVPPPIGMLPAESEGERAHESGEACLFYVGTTRARDSLILSYSERYGKQKAKRSGYIDALVVGLPDERVRRVYWQNELPAPADGSEEEPISLPQPSSAFIKFMQPKRLRSSHVEDYLICPRRYAYSSIYAFSRTEGSFLSFWNATHETIKALFTRVAEADVPRSKAEVAELFQQHWQAQDGESEPFARLYERHGREVVEQIWEQFLNGQSQDWRLRQSLSVELAGYTIEVTIDRIEEATQADASTKLVRTRFGKSKSKPNPGMREFLYLHAQRQHYPGSDGMVQTHNLSTGEIQEIHITARKEDSLLGDVEQAVRGIERQDFTPRPDVHTCSTCPFFLICPA